MPIEIVVMVSQARDVSKNLLEMYLNTWFITFRGTEDDEDDIDK